MNGPARSERDAVDLVDAAQDRVAGLLVARTGAVVGIGIDAVEIGRLGMMLSRRHHLGARLFTPGERAYAGEARDPTPRLATRFAAKEAVMKALGVGLGAFAFHDVEVVREGTDPPRLVIHGAAARLSTRSGAVRWHLSLSHTDALALAVVVGDGGGA